MQERFLRFSRAIAEIDRCWHKLVAEELARFGLNSPHAVYLLVLDRYEEGMTGAELSDLCGKDKADVSRMTSILEKRGFLRKEEVGRTRYRARLILTDAGKELADHVRARATQAVELAGFGISEEDRAVFYQCLDTITANLVRLSEDGLPVSHKE